MNDTALPHCGLIRRLAAIVYDAVLLFGVVFLASALIQPFTKVINPGNPFFTLYFVAVVFAFFGWFWTHGGQTLGMRAWRVRVQRPDGQPITWGQAALRYLVAILSWAVLGLGFLWSLIDREKRTWHDLVSETVLVVVPKEKKKK
ncbi:MAG: RDD family protein [Thiohalomonadaceae bacterium]